MHWPEVLNMTLISCVSPYPPHYCYCSIMMPLCDCATAVMQRVEDSLRESQGYSLSSSPPLMFCNVKPLWQWPSLSNMTLRLPSPPPLRLAARSLPPSCTTASSSSSCGCSALLWWHSACMRKWDGSSWSDGGLFLSWPTVSEGAGSGSHALSSQSRRRVFFLWLVEEIIL